MFDQPLIQRKLSRLALYVTELKGISNQPKQDFLTSGLHYQAERLIELLVGTALDINFHFIKVLDLTPPTQYKESFLILGKAGILSASLAQKIANSAGLRNLLIHQYDDIDLDRLFDGLSEGMKDYEDYIQAIGQYIAQNSQDK